MVSDQNRSTTSEINHIGRRQIFQQHLFDTNESEVHFSSDNIMNARKRSSRIIHGVLRREVLLPI